MRFSRNKSQRVLRLFWTLPLAALLCCVKPVKAEEPSEESKGWRWSVLLYGLGAGVSGDLSIHQHPTDFDRGLDELIDDMDFAAMGRAGIGYGRWNLAVDVIYTDLDASTTKPPADADITQWMVQPTLGYQILKWFEAT